MTRINLVPVSDLYDQHLMAEYRELPRVFSYSESLSKIPKDIPKSFTLGKGHVKFFSNKLAYLLDRQRQLMDELRSRGFKITFDIKTLEDRFKTIDSKFKLHYNPSELEIAISKQRLDEKVSQKPEWYRKTIT